MHVSHKATETVRARQGFVLVIVLWILAALTVITIGFAQRSSLELRASAYALDHEQAIMMARGAAHRGMLELQNKWLKDLASESEGITHLGQPWAQPTNTLREGLFTFDEAEFENDTARFLIRDAESLININRVSEEVLAEMDGIGRRLARDIVRRREEETEGGEAPIPFQAIEELRYMADLDDEVWFGEDDEPGLKDVFTTHGDGMINVNTASAAVLAVLPDVGEDGAERIIEYRAGPDGEVGTPDDRGFRSLQEVSDLVGLRGDGMQSINAYCKVNSSVFIIQGMATRRAGKVVANVKAVAFVNRNMAQILSWREEPLGS